MENPKTLDRALTVTREDIRTAHLNGAFLSLEERVSSQEAASTLLIACQRLLSLVVETANVAERLEEELLSRGVILPQDSRPPPTVACETLLGWLRTEWTRRHKTQLKKDGPSLTH